MSKTFMSGLYGSSVRKSTWKRPERNARLAGSFGCFQPADPVNRRLRAIAERTDPGRCPCVISLRSSLGRGEVW